MLGVLPDLTFPMDVLHLAMGDSALLLTDGLYSARRPDGKRIQLGEVAPVFARDERVATLIQRMRGESAFDDDATAISVQRAD